MIKIEAEPKQHEWENCGEGKESQNYTLLIDYLFDSPLVSIRISIEILASLSRYQFQSPSWTTEIINETTIM